MKKDTVAEVRRPAQEGIRRSLVPAVLQQKNATAIRSYHFTPSSTTTEARRRVVRDAGLALGNVGHFVVGKRDDGGAGCSAACAGGHHAWGDRAPSSPG